MRRGTTDMDVSQEVIFLVRYSYLAISAVSHVKEGRQAPRHHAPGLEPARNAAGCQAVMEFVLNYPRFCSDLESCSNACS